MTVPEALHLLSEAGTVEVHGGKLRVGFHKKERDRLQPALEVLRQHVAEALEALAADPIEAELIAAGQAPEIIAEVLAFKAAFGGKLTLVPPGGDNGFNPTSEEEWIYDTADKAFDENRKLRDAEYAGLDLAAKERIADERSRNERKAWNEGQRLIQHGYAKWCRFHDAYPVQADAHRAEHADKEDERKYFIDFASLKSVAGKRIPGKAAL